jgi:hypothetical protein
MPVFGPSLGARQLIVGDNKLTAPVAAAHGQDFAHDRFDGCRPQNSAAGPGRQLEWRPRVALPGPARQ